VYAVEIDPAVVEIAEKYFHTRSDNHTHIITADAFRYFDRTKLRFDVVYMDAFLKPSRQTDAAGVPLRMKTAAFYKDLAAKLAPQGLVVFNLNVNDSLPEDIATIRAAFGQCYIFRAQKHQRGGDRLGRQVAAVAGRPARAGPTPGPPLPGHVFVSGIA